ncbi:MAG: hypothetical protein SVN78_10260 [Deferribacterota bacterium]|nr:hypothetical protein [Deferribacterota bacterium]
MYRSKVIFLFLIVYQILTINELYSNDFQKEIVSDFKQVSAYILDKDGDYFIIDAGIEDGIKVGDIFSLINKKTIIHPKTNKEMAYDVVVSHLKVVQVKNNYSLIEPLDNRLDQIEIGSKTLRYESVPSTFFDLTGKGKYIYLYLKKNLPFLKWEDYKYIKDAKKEVFNKAFNKKEISLAFIAYNDRIEVYSGDGSLINVYQYVNGVDSISKKDNDINKSVIAAAKLKNGNNVLSKSNKVDAKNSKSLLGNTVTYEKLKRIESFPFYTKMSDFLKVGDELYIAAINDNSIRVININNPDALDIKVDIPDNNEGLTIQWVKLEEKDSPYIIINTWSELHNRVISYLLKINGENLSILDSSYSIMGVFDRDKNGKKTFILGQDYDPEEFYGKRIRVYNIKNDRFNKGEYIYEYPTKFTVLSSAISDITGDGVNENMFIHNNILYIYSGKDLIYTSSKIIGNNASMLTYEINPKSPYVRQNTVSLEFPPIIKDIDGDGTLELLTIASKRNVLSSIVGVNEIEDNWLIFFKYKNNQFIKGSIDKIVEKHIKGFTIFNNKIIAVVSAKKGLLKDIKETTDIVVF